ncbi:MAG: hypothetical protein JOZ24_12000, partial [Candidatus Eremiobacteraeota bacterium]|nr:hypothetical protein [Candidatus Eremiobacteraeota bacterium]
ERAAAQKSAGSSRIVAAPVAAPSVPTPPPATILIPSAVAAPRSGQPPGRVPLFEAFGDPAHARTAVVLAEILAPPIALR